MSITRDNHYVPQWHQEGFFTAGKNTLWLLNMEPHTFRRGDGTTGTGRSMFNSPTSRAFVQRDLYSTFFGTQVNDEIERKLFGGFDTRGAPAVRAFFNDDQHEWHNHFEDFFEYLDIQKVRTPKGLEWLRRQYPELSQNELMLEMQGIRMLNVTTWTTGVREIVSAVNSETKFILSDHPITVYNHAIPPAPGQQQLNDPSIALKGSQTLFPLSQDYCLILTNLEYANNPASPPKQKRTFARSYKPTMVSTIEFIKSREFTDEEVVEVNYVLKACAKRYIAAGKKDWLYPEQTVTKSWSEIRSTLLPPTDQLYRFGGEMYASYDSGYVHYQDEFGRTEKPREWLIKTEPKAPIRAREYCPCGSGLSFGECCSKKPQQHRTTWTEKSIRERNMMLFNGLENLFDLRNGDWDTMRAEMTDEKIARMYGMYESLWPLETDLLSMLPKPDGKFRSVYTGSLHPKHILEFALGSSLYFGEVLIQTPFVHPGTLAKEMRPTENPRRYRGEALKTLLTLFQIMPLVESGRVNLIPDPCDFDFHLRDQMMAMARHRAKDMPFDAADDPRLQDTFKEDAIRMMMSLPAEVLARQMARLPVEGPSLSQEDLAQALMQMRSDDILAVYQEDSLADGGQLQIMKMAPNFEIAMYLAQTTGAQILTDSPHRWRELQAALNRRFMGTAPALHELTRTVRASPFDFPVTQPAIEHFSGDPGFEAMTSALGNAFNYVRDRSEADTKPNFEKQLAARFVRGKEVADAAISKAKFPGAIGRVTTMFRFGGFQDNTVNRLLLMSSSEHHLPSVPMATFIERYRKS